MFVVCFIKNLTWVCIQIIKSDHKIWTLSTDHTTSFLLYLFCPLSCCILLSFLFVALPPSLPYGLYWPQCSHPSWPLLHSDTKSDGQRVSEGSCCQVVFEKQAASFFQCKKRGTSSASKDTVQHSSCKNASFWPLLLMCGGIPVSLQSETHSETWLSYTDI